MLKRLSIILLTMTIIITLAACGSEGQTEITEAETVTTEPVRSYQMAVVYADLEGNAELTAVKDFDLAAYTNRNNAEISADKLAGGWPVPEDAVGSEIPEDARTAFDKASEQFT